MQLDHLDACRRPELKCPERWRFADEAVVERELDLGLLRRDRQMDEPRHLGTALVVVILERSRPEEIPAAEPAYALDPQIASR
jgi:hypothetical protein